LARWQSRAVQKLGLLWQSIVLAEAEAVAVSEAEAEAEPEAGLPTFGNARPKCTYYPQ